MTNIVAVEFAEVTTESGWTLRYSIRASDLDSFIRSRNTANVTAERVYVRFPNGEVIRSFAKTWWSVATGQLHLIGAGAKTLALVEKLSE